MTNRVDYLSDQLVHLLGKLKPVSEVVPPDSLANGVTVKPSSASAAGRKQQAEERRREDTRNLTNDYRQRLVKRAAQLDMQQSILQNDLRQLEDMQSELKQLSKQLEELQIAENEELSAVQTGERFRLVDQERLKFYELDGRIELLLNQSGASVQDLPGGQVPEESFGTMIKKGWAWALTAGAVIGLSVILAALIVLQAWR